jgi:predicted ATPase
MSGSSQPRFNTIELKADLLKTPFGIHTNWHVITGAPSCGKTTLINLLAGKGFQIAPEGARQYMEKEIARGRTVEEIRSDVVNLQRILKDIQVEIERGLQAKECIFLDQALPDCLAWYRVFGLNPNECLHECFRYRYASVLVLDQLPLQHDGLRIKDTALQSFIDEWHTRDYNALGYSITRVPVMLPEERLAFVLRVLSEQALI